MKSHSSSISEVEQICPKVYEEIIQSLEAEVRKHIRIEQQLKLHIESVENRVEELEREQEKQEKSKGQFEENKELLAKKQKLIEESLRFSIRASSISDTEVFYLTQCHHSGALLTQPLCEIHCAD